ncbi:translation initiation factor IF-2 [Chloroflexota bacterium]
MTEASAPKKTTKAAGTKKRAKRGLPIPSSLTVKQLGELIDIDPITVIKDLMKKGIMVTINQLIDYNTAAMVAKDLSVEVHEEPSVDQAKEAPKYHRFAIDDASAKKPRPPVITIMGHVDHGKTRLLDAIRQTNVMDSEAGGITQRIGAYQVEVNGHKITFLDTPGHAAFTTMRARGAHVTDIAILVVAADDGIMPQTIEAIDHAKAAEVPIVIAVNKIDKPEANVDRVKQQLTEHNLLIEEWGGEVICIPLSAKTGEGIPDLLEHLLLLAEILELTADPERKALGLVIESEMDTTKGPLATVLVQQGTLKVGDSVVVGDTWGKIKAMFNDKGKHARKAGPSTPVEIMGLNSVPQAGDGFKAVADDKAARTQVTKALREKEATTMQAAKLLSLEDIYNQIKSGAVKDLKIILKTDVQGSVEPVRSSLERLEVEGIKVRIIHSGTGTITEQDVFLAVASQAIVIGFNIRAEEGARRLADSEGVDVRSYNVIYNLIEDVEKALKGLLEPIIIEVIDGHAEVRTVFSVGRRDMIAGSYITDGKVVRAASARIVREGKMIHEATINGLKRFKDDAREVLTGFECGIGVDGFYEFKVGDIIESYHKEEAHRA